MLSSVLLSLQQQKALIKMTCYRADRLAMQYCYAHLSSCLNWIHLWGAVAEIQGLTPASPKPDTDACLLCPCSGIWHSAGDSFMCRRLHDTMQRLRPPSEAFHTVVCMRVGMLLVPPQLLHICMAPPWHKAVSIQKSSCTSTLAEILRSPPAAQGAKCLSAQPENPSMCIV